MVLISSDVQKADTEVAKNIRRRTDAIQGCFIYIFKIPIHKLSIHSPQLPYFYAVFSNNFGLFQQNKLLFATFLF